MDKLKAEIARKRSLTEAVRSSIAPSNISKDISDREVAEVQNSTTLLKSSYIRQKDMDNWMQLQREEEQRRLEESKLEELARKRPKTLPLENQKNCSDFPDSESKTIVSSKIIPKDSKIDAGNISLQESYQKYRHFHALSLNEVKLNLREMRQPVTLFGEQPSDRIQRLIAISIAQGSVENIKLSEEEMKEQDEPDSEEENSDEEADVKSDVGGAVNSSANSSHAKSHLRFDPSIQYHKLTHFSQEKMIYKFFKSVLKQWELDLKNRSDYEKSIAKGKMETKTQKQCKDYIRPLFKLCKRKQVPPDILYKLHLMVQYCEEGNFLKANDEYIKTAIGNSAWPIGLTMVGIHERSGRERISTSKIAHVMNNELERKYLTSVKRLMTYAQSLRPDVPPSMKVLN